MEHVLSHTHTYTHTYTYTYIHTCIHTHTYTYIHIHTYTYIHTHTYTYTHTNIYICIYISYRIISNCISYTNRGASLVTHTLNCSFSFDVSCDSRLHRPLTMGSMVEPIATTITAYSITHTESRRSWMSEDSISGA